MDTECSLMRAFRSKDQRHVAERNDCVYQQGNADYTRVSLQHEGQDQHTRSDIPDALQAELPHGLPVLQRERKTKTAHAAPGRKRYIPPITTMPAETKMAMPLANQNMVASFLESR